MNKIFAFCETEDGENWAKAWRHGAGNHETWDKIGVKCRTFRDTDNHTLVGVLFDVPDVAAFESLLETDEIKQAMAEHRLKMETFRMLTEFTP
jgi:hypothetical protein